MEIKTLKGKAILPYLDKLAELRIKIFHEYPYLYAGDLDYETNYLRRYAQCSQSILVIAFSNSLVVGASTAIPLEFEVAEFQKPFEENNISVKDVFYFGESVLLPDYRGKGVYKHFFQNRENTAQKYGAKITAFCAVDRPSNDPKRPANYVPLNATWERYGYRKHPELCAYYEWKEIGENTMTAKPLIFWLKTL